MTITWRERVLHLLDEAERKNSDKRITLVGLAAAVGKSRVSLWRDKEIRERYGIVREMRTTDGANSKKRRTGDQRIRALQMELQKLRDENGRLLQNFVVICRRLNDKGIDPVSVLGVVTPTRRDKAWTCAILPWKDC